MFKIDWVEFLESNDSAKGKGIVMRIIKFTNDGKTCILKDLSSNRDACMDIAHIVADVRKGYLYLTNPSVLKRKIGC